MNWMLVTYRTTDYRYKMYAVVPALYVSDLLDWLKLSESAEIVSVTDNPVRELPGISAFRPPENWPSYRACEQYILVSDLVGSAR
jgi:hypothetical protein